MIPMKHRQNPRQFIAGDIDNGEAETTTVTFEKIQDEESVVSELIVETNEETKDFLDRIIARSSSFHKARRVTALTVRAIENILRKKGIKEPTSIAEIQDAERRLIKMVQTGMEVNHKQVQNLSPRRNLESQR